MIRYRGRFAPSPTGGLHAGSLATALASWLDARAQGGQWLLRIEDTDSTRCSVDTGKLIIHQLQVHGLIPDEPPLWQSTCESAYAWALQRLVDQGLVYPCGCSRQTIVQAVTGYSAYTAYPGICRRGLNGKTARAIRVRTDSPTGADHVINWTDRRLGPQHQNLTREVGDFILRRADGVWAYQLAVVVDDAAQGITHVVRGADLADNTARQIHLQQLLGAPTPIYLHTPLVCAADGQKLSKQTGAAPLDLTQPLRNLRAAAVAIGISEEFGSADTADDVSSNSNTRLAAWLAAACNSWAHGGHLLR